MAELCARLEVEQPDVPGGEGVIYVKSRWFATRFSLAISDGLNAWTCEASEEEVSRKAFSWDETVAKYLEDAQRCLGCQIAGSKYSFHTLADGARKFSWTQEKNGVQLLAHWKVESSHDPKETTSNILDCLMRGSSRLTEELQRKNLSFERMKAEAERAQAQSLKFAEQKIQFEADVYKKFVAVLNSKREKLRELRELGLQQLPGGTIKGKEEMAEQTESEDEFDDTDEEDDRPSEDKRPQADDGEVGGKVDDDDSQATDILPDSPPGSVSGPDHGPSPSHLDAKKQAGDQKSEMLVTRTSPLKPPQLDANKQGEEKKPEPSVAKSSYLKPPAEPFADAASLLSGPTYTSAPRKRRR